MSYAPAAAAAATAAAAAAKETRTHAFKGWMPFLASFTAQRESQQPAAAHRSTTMMNRNDGIENNIGQLHAPERTLESSLYLEEVAIISPLSDTCSRPDSPPQASNIKSGTGTGTADSAVKPKCTGAGTSFSHQQDVSTGPSLPSSTSASTCSSKSFEEKSTRADNVIASTSVAVSAFVADLPAQETCIAVAGDISNQDDRPLITSNQQGILKNTRTCTPAAGTVAPTTTTTGTFYYCEGTGALSLSPRPGSYRKSTEKGHLSKALEVLPDVNTCDDSEDDSNDDNDDDNYNNDEGMSSCFLAQ